MSYLIASFAITAVVLVGYGWSLLSERRGFEARD